MSDPKRPTVPDDPSDLPMFGLPSAPGESDPLERRPEAAPAEPAAVPVAEPDPVAAAPDPAPAAEDPREVARRLVEEARKKAAPAPDPREVARKLAEEARKKAAPRPNLADLSGTAFKGVPPPAKAAPAPEPRSESPTAKLAARANVARPAALDPLAAIEAARRAEEEARRAPPAAGAPAAARAATPAPAAPKANAGDVLARTLPGAEAIREIAISNTTVAKALWTAHRVRALGTHDLALVGAACTVLDALDRVPAGGLVVVEATVASQRVGVWVDVWRGAVIAITPQPEFTLAGLI